MDSDQVLIFFFRFLGYGMFGFFLETVNAAVGIDLTLGLKVQRRVPMKYLEGFVSLYMLPIHGLGMYFGFEPVYQAISSWPVLGRFAVWAIAITGVEALTGFLYHKTIGFYTWDYYKLSRFKVFKEGYTLWTLVPQWGVAGLIMEVYSSLLQDLSPHALSFFKQYFS